MFGSLLWILGLLAITTAIGLTLIHRYPHLVGFVHNSALVVFATVCLVGGLSMVRHGLSPFNELRERLAERRMTLQVTDEARRFIARQGFDPVYGARPLRRFIAREVETRIGRALLAGDARDGAVIRVDVIDTELTVTYENSAEK